MGDLPVNLQHKSFIRTGNKKTGGLDIGFEQTLLKNRPEWNFLRADIRELTPEIIRKKIGKKPNIVIGDPPCQPFSVAGKQQATKDHCLRIKILFV